MSEEPEQWAVKQHLKKYPKCEWLCPHTNKHNLGEELPVMETYEPSKTPAYIIESDGDAWFCHDSTFINIVESDEVCFAKTPQEALAQFMEKYRVPVDEKLKEVK